ncbi:MAG: hypothetical protein LC792_17700 [Actinobacteria bacterium]|nr:hypothetical protein [Actinomycetota bacterium]
MPDVGPGIKRLSTDLTPDAARRKVNRLKARVGRWLDGGERLYAEMEDLHRGRAWLALGHATWGELVRAEFGLSRARSYQILDEGAVIAAIQNSAAKAIAPAPADRPASRPVRVSPRKARSVSKADLGDLTEAIEAKVIEGADPQSVVDEVLDEPRWRKARTDTEVATELERARRAPVVGPTDADLAAIEAESTNGAEPERPESTKPKSRPAVAAPSRGPAGREVEAALSDILRRDPVETMAHLRPADARRLVGELEAWLVAAKSVLVVPGRRTEVAPRFKK